MAQLIKSQPQRQPYLQIELVAGALEIALEQKIEQPLPAQDPQRQLRRQRRIGSLYAGIQLRVEEIGGIGVFRGDASQHVKRNPPRCRNWHLQSLTARRNV